MNEEKLICDEEFVYGDSVHDAVPRCVSVSLNSFTTCSKVCALSSYKGNILLVHSISMPTGMQGLLCSYATISSYRELMKNKNLVWLLKKK